MPLYALLRPDDAIDRYEANIDPTVSTRSGWRWVEVDDRPSPQLGPLQVSRQTIEVAGGKVVRGWSVTTLAPTSGDVNGERDRRLLVFKFGGKEFDFDAFSAMNIAGAGTLAFAAIINGAQPGNLRWADPNADFGWIARDNARVPMDAQTCFAFAQAAANWRAAHIYAARALKDAPGGIAADYAVDARWPS